MNPRDLICTSVVLALVALAPSASAADTWRDPEALFVGAATLRDGAGGWALGGSNLFDPDDPLSQRTIRQVLPDGSVRVHSTELPRGVAFAAAAWHEGDVILAGGEVRRGLHEATREIVRFDPGGGIVETLPVELDVGLARAAAIVRGDELHLLGGTRCAQRPHPCEAAEGGFVVDLETGALEPFPFPALRELTALDLSDGRVLVVPASGSDLVLYTPADRRYVAQPAEMVPAAGRFAFDWQGVPCVAGGSSAEASAHREVHCFEVHGDEIRVMRHADLPTPHGGGIAIGEGPVLLVGGVADCGICGRVQRIEALDPPARVVGAGVAVALAGLALSGGLRRRAGPP